MYIHKGVKVADESSLNTQASEKATHGAKDDRLAMTVDGRGRFGSIYEREEEGSPVWSQNMFTRAREMAMEYFNST